MINRQVCVFIYILIIDPHSSRDSPKLFAFSHSFILHISRLTKETNQFYELFERNSFCCLAPRNSSIRWAQTAKLCNCNYVIVRSNNIFLNLFNYRLKIPVPYSLGRKHGLCRNGTRLTYMHISKWNLGSIYFDWYHFSNHNAHLTSKTEAPNWWPRFVIVNAGSPLR